jgi:TIR domain
MSLTSTVSTSLRRRGLNPWLDADQVRPGLPFQDVIQAATSQVKSAAIFVGAHGVGPWEVVELRSLVSRCVKDGLHVIPVLLPGAALPDNLLFLAEFSIVEFRGAVDESDVIDRLEWGITGRRPERRAATGGRR